LEKKFGEAFENCSWQKKNRNINFHKQAVISIYISTACKRQNRTGYSLLIDVQRGSRGVLQGEVRLPALTHAEALSSSAAGSSSCPPLSQTGKLNIYPVRARSARHD